MNPDLQKAMEQRRRKTESKTEDPRTDLAATPAISSTKKQLSKVSMGQDLQAIMARRRKMAGDASSDEDEIPPVPPQSKSTPHDEPPEKTRSSAKLSTHLDQKGDPGRRKQATDGESTVSGSNLSKSGERRSRRKPRGNGNEAEDSNERRKMRTRRSKSGDSLSDELSVDLSVNSRRRRSSDEDTISSGLSSGRRGRRSDDKNLPPAAARSSRQNLALGNSSDHAGSVASTPEPSEKRDKDLNRKKSSSRSSSPGKDEQPVIKDTKGRPKPSAGQGIVDSQQKQKRSSTGNSDGSLDSTKKASVSGWGDFPAFGGADGFESSSVPIDDGFVSFGNFTMSANNNDTASGAFDFPLPSNDEKSNVDRGKSLSKNDFDVPFSSSPFESLPAFSTFDVNFPPMDSNGFSSLPSVEKVAQQKMWDKSPLNGDLPNRAILKPILFQEVAMRYELHVSPVNNPSNGNFICCTENDGILMIIEIDPSRGNLHVSSIAVLSMEFRQKVLAKYNIIVHKVEHVLALSAGLQLSNGQSQTDIAVILDLFTLESNQVLRVVAVWQWGVGTMHPITLISPPSGGEYSFEPNTLRNANGLLFLAGASTKGPCIFICKPSVKETWSANSLGGTGRISCITAPSSSRRIFPYLVIAMEDGAISMWTYDSALLPLSSKESVANQRWIFPACRLEASAFFASRDTGSESVGYCTQLELIEYEPSHSSLPLLAAAFQNGFVVFHVPVVEDKVTKLGFKSPDTSPSMTLAQVTSIEPIVAKKWEDRHYEKASVAWLHAGPHHGPCLALLLNGGETSANRVFIGTIGFPLYDRDLGTKRVSESLISFRVLSNIDFDEEPDEKPIGFLSGSNISSFIAFSKKGMLCLTFRDASIPKSKPEGTVAALSRPVLSLPSGLSSLGEVLLLDDDSQLHLFSLLQCARTKGDGEDQTFQWSPPRMRHWLCRASVGDTKKQQHTMEKETSEEAHGGAETDVVCELFHEKLTNYVPVRITRYRDTSFCAIAYRSALVNSPEGMIDVNCDASLFAFVDWSASSVVIEVLQARDVAFLPSAGAGGVRGLLLSWNGSTLTYFEWDVQKKCFNMKSAYRPIIGVDPNNPKDFLDCRRIFTFEGAGKVALAAAATCIRDNKSCIVISELSDAETISEDTWSAILPNTETDRSCYFEKHEEINTMIGLEDDDNGYRNFAVSTSDRILILTSGLTIAAQADVVEPCSALAPLGAFAVGYIMGNKLCYLCCLDGHLASGSIFSFPLSKYQYGLVSIRPDRIVFFERQSGSQTVKYGQNANWFKLHVPKTVPVMLLEPMIANAVCVGGKQNLSSPVLRVVIEKFGRKVASITHGESEGIGSFGSGLSARVFEILGRYGLTHASTWLLTGTVQFQRNSNSRILSPWLSVAQKMRGCCSSDTLLHLVSNGDQYYSDYLKSPDHNMTSTLPRQSDPSMYLCRAYAENAMQKGEMVDVLKMFDLCGTQSAEHILVHLASMRERKSPNSFLRVLRGYSDTSLYTSSAYASLAVFLSEQQTRQTQVDTDARTSLAKSLAPTLQNGMRVGRARHKLIGETALAEFGQSQIQDPDPLWATSCNEAKHVWNEGPRNQKENLLMLDRIDDWLGRRRPLVLGKEGASAARDRGEKTLADILNQDDDDSFGEKSDIDSEVDVWVEGVGEGRSDEANLCGYFRMSEGEDADFAWKVEGLQDLTPYKNKLILVGETDGFSLQQSTSSVDEGEAGKVKSLYDVVFDLSGIGKASGLALAATRGCSIDVGVLHTSDRQARKKCTVEFWYYVPSALSHSMILARRTVGPCADDFAKIFLATERDCVLWELTLLTNGNLEFRSCGGTVLLSSDNYSPSNSDPTDDEEEIRHDRAVLGRWNHACIVLSSNGLSLSECSVSMYMKGIEVSSGEVSMLPQGNEANDLNSPGKLDEIMQKSHLVFGLNHTPGFRMTDLRIWACERSAEDTQSFMFEYLTAAETKKKFKLKISSKNKSNVSGVGKGAKAGELRQSLFATTKTAGKSASGFSKGLSLAPPPKATVSTISPEIDENVAGGHPSNASFETSFDSFNQPEIVHSTNGSVVKKQNTGNSHPKDSVQDDSEEPVTLWDTALPLSKQIRSSAAAALIRGPPATRHFGGNRGGLPDFSGMERSGVGGIAICGSEKTIVWRDNEDPPALTYPIGASGAVVSDQMDDIGSEFLCCFLARERRMIVFELHSKTVVVELQMTTKLNFWRYLPPEAAENTLCFMLVTPVGGFHWMPLEESPRPHQVWKRGPDLQGKKVVSYEEGGSNGLDESEIRSKLGLVMVTKETGDGTLESWIIPINGDSRAVQVSDDVLGACFCQPPIIEDGSFLPLLVTVHNLDEGIYVNILSVREPEKGSIELGEIEVSHLIEMSDFKHIDLKPPSLAMGTFPEALCCSLSNIIVVIIRRKGLIAAFELEDDDLSLIAQETVGHYIVDAVMRYSLEVGGAEIVMMLSDTENPKDGRIVSFCFRSAV